MGCTCPETKNGPTSKVTFWTWGWFTSRAESYDKAFSFIIEKNKAQLWTFKKYMIAVANCDGTDIWSGPWIILDSAHPSIKSPHFF